jgi:hypothetical protein
VSVKVRSVLREKSSGSGQGADVLVELWQGSDPGVGMVVELS